MNGAALEERRLRKGCATVARRIVIEFGRGLEGTAVAGNEGSALRISKLGESPADASIQGRFSLRRT